MGAGRPGRVTEPQTLTEIRSMLEARGLSPRKSMGQNFLVDRNLVAKLARRAGVGENDIVFEVGPGTGTLTGELLASGARVVAVELDRGLAELLRERFAEPIRGGRLTLIEGDCLESKSRINQTAIDALGTAPFKLVANLPYHAATPLMLTLITTHPACRSMHVTIQREVAERLSAPPGGKRYGSISVVAACVMPARAFAGLPGECFWPRPTVASAMVELTRLDDPHTDDPVALAAFCRDAFAGRRKQLQTLLRSMGRPPERWPEGINPTDRIESLPPERISALEHATRNL
jgi:16S rRNA (adenine1518-N6/adenine1519-N6)-dimethyltransferase